MKHDRNTAPAGAAAMTYCRAGQRGRLRSRLSSAEAAARRTIDPRRHDWYALRTQPGKERITRLLLSEIGMPAWTPLEHRHQRASRYSQRMVRRPRILLVGYVLVGLASGDPGEAALAEAMRLRTVTGIVVSDGQPARLERAAVERLMLMDCGEIVRLPGPGELMRLVDGPLAGIHVEGELVELREIRGAQARILTRLFGGLEVEVPLERLAIP